MMRELQRQRQRAKGVTLEVRAMADAVAEALAAGGAEATEHGLESTFTSQTDSGEVGFASLTSPTSRPTSRRPSGNRW